MRDHSVRTVAEKQTSPEIASGDVFRPAVRTRPGAGTFHVGSAPSARPVR